MKTFITDPNTYKTIADVPEKLQGALKFAHSTGVPADALAVIYDMPLYWILTIVVDKPVLLN